MDVNSLQAAEIALKTMGITRMSPEEYLAIRLRLKKRKELLDVKGALVERSD